MATSSFGKTGSIVTSRFGAVPYYANCGLRAVMPETGRILSIDLYLGKYSTVTPTVWGMIWNRSNGAILAQSASQEITNQADAYNECIKYTFTFGSKPQVLKDTLLWIGYAKASNESGHSLRFGFASSGSGYAVDSNDTSQGSPGVMSAARTWADEAIYVLVTYETGGQVKVFGTAFANKPVKVWNGSAWVEKPVKVWNGSAWVESNS
ncbi:MAG: hypothetical protein WBL80_03965 [Erysipelotrichaceae bacterium]